MIIKDASTGFSAGVTHEGFLTGLSVVESQLLHHSFVHGASYSSGNGAVTHNGSDNTVFFLQNTSTTDKFFIQKLFASTTDTAGCLVTLYRGGVYGSGGTAAGATNLNFSVNIPASLTTYYATGAITMATAGTPIFGGYCNIGFTVFDVDGGIVLGANDIIYLNMKGTNAKLGSVGLLGFFHGGDY